MRVQFVVSMRGSLVTGGEIYLHKVSDFLQKSGDSVQILSFQQLPGWLRRRPLFCNVFTYFKILFRQGVIIEPENMRASLFVCNWLLQFSRSRKTVVFMQSVRFGRSDPWPTSWRQRLVCQIFLRTADLVIANSNYVRDAAVALGARPGRVKVINPATQSLPGEYENIPRATTTQPMVLCVANLEERKGQEYLLKALAELPNRDFTLTLVGTERETDYAAKLRGIARLMGLSDRVHFAGRLEGTDLAAAYQKADIFVLPSLTEGYGLVLLEAISFGLPVVATKVGGIPEVVSDGVEAILVPPRDEKALAEAIAELLTDQVKRTEMGQRGMARAKAQPSWNEVCRQFRAALLEVWRS